MKAELNVWDEKQRAESRFKDVLSKAFGLSLAQCGRRI